jgi:hypothetical protein
MIVLNKLFIITAWARALVQRPDVRSIGKQTTEDPGGEAAQAGWILSGCAG